MAIAAQRFKFLDHETNLPVADFVKIADNSVYNLVNNISDTAIEGAQGNKELMVGLQNGLSNLQEAVTSVSSEAMSAISSTLDSVVDSIKNLELPSFVKDIFESIKKLDLSGLKSFLKKALRVGSQFLCNNIDFLKLFMLGYALNRNIMGGLLLALLLSWLDRYCKSFNKKEMAVANKKQKVEMMFPYQGTKINDSNAFGSYNDLFKNMLDYNGSRYTPTPVMNTNSFLSNVSSGNISYAMSNLRNSEISHIDRNRYRNTLTQALPNYPTNSIEYRNILSGLGQLNSLPLVSSQRRDSNIRYSNLSDTLGRSIQNLVKNINIGNIPSFNFNSIEKGLLNKLTGLKSSASYSNDFMTRGTNSSSYNTFKFNNLVPAFNQEEQNYLNGLNGNRNNHRFNDLHPTTEQFLI